MNQKKLLRKEIQSLRDTLDSEVKVQYDQIICNRLMAAIDVTKVKTVHSFIPMGSEIDIKPVIQWLLDHNIKVICPKSLKNRILQNLVLSSLNALDEGVFGTQFPSGGNVYEGNIDVAIVPGLAFDKAGFRLGYGVGYYDTFLAQHKNIQTIGIGYHFQLIDSVPTEAHDVPMKVIISNV